MLDDRKKLILTEIINSYIKNAEPVGSRTLAKNPKIGVSSATIRNEMSDLEDLGFLSKTHTSSGRVPSDKGYRFYVNLMLDEGFKINESLVEKLNRDIYHKYSSIYEIYDETNKLLSENTNYITVIISPIINSSTIEYLKLDVIMDEKLLLILIGANGISKSYILNNKFDEGVSLDEFENSLRSILINKSLDELEDIYEFIPDDYPNRELLEEILDIGIHFLDKNDDYELFLSGIRNTINFWDRDNFEEAKSFLEFIDDEENLLKLILNDKSNDLVDFKIGTENNRKVLENISIIRSQYTTPRNRRGSISLIGPTRMDYKRLSNILYNFSITLSNLK